MIVDLLKSQEFKKLEKEYKFLSRAREKLSSLENLPYAVLDIETTGLDPAKSEIIEIAVLKIENKEIKDIFNTLINPFNPIPGEITRLTGINNDMVKSQPAFKDIINKFQKFIGGSYLVAHNTDFDISFLKHYLGIYDQTLDNTVLCSLKLSRSLLRLESNRLGRVAEYFGIKQKNAHRALGDAEATYQIWLKLLELAKQKNILSLEELKKIC